MRESEVIDVLLWLKRAGWSDLGEHSPENIAHIEPRVQRLLVVPSQLQDDDTFEMVTRATLGVEAFDQMFPDGYPRPASDPEEVLYNEVTSCSSPGSMGPG